MSHLNKTTAAVIGISALTTIATVYIAKNECQFTKDLKLRVKQFLDNAE
jgi:hypothetical protein